MKKCVTVVTFLLSLLYLSCSNDGNLSSDSNEPQTIKSLVSHIEGTTVWSAELENERLSQKLGADNEVLSSGLVLTKENTRIFRHYKPAVYPSFSDFGSLDISSMEYKYSSSAEQICKEFADFNEEKLFSFFLANYRFNYVFFIQSLKKGWKEEFGIDFPESEIFSRWILGEAFTTDNLIQIPVRFYCNMGFVDVTLYMKTNQENSIYNIKIVRWGKNG